MFKKLFSPEWLLVILAIATLLMPSVRCNPHDDDASYIDILPSNDPPMPDDSLPHYIYQRIADSIKNVKTKKELISQSFGSGLFFFSIGYSEIDDDMWSTERPDTPQMSYYLRLVGYKLEPDTRFKVEDKKWLIEKPAWDTVRNDGEVWDQGVLVSTQSRQGHLVSTPVSIRYESDRSNSQAAGSALIPVSHQQFIFLKIIVWILFLGVGWFCVYAVLLTPAAIIIRIANGNSFSERNYRGLYITGWTLIGVALLPVILGLIMRFAFQGFIPPEVHYSIYENLFQYKSALVAGLITLILARAFQKGYELQLDNNSIV